MASLRCPECLTNWPNTVKDFGQCPECHARCWYSTSKAIDAGEAHTRMCWAKFDRFMQKRDAAQLKELEGIPTLTEEEPVSSD